MGDGISRRAFLGGSAASLLHAEDRQKPFTINDDGAWSWFEDERAIVHNGKLIAGSVAAGTHDPARRGNVEVAVFDLRRGARSLSTLHANLQYDDHNSPALLVLPDRHILAAYAKHGPENRFYYRISERPDDAASWQSEQTFTPSESSRITYSNLHYLRNENGGRGRLYNFFRGLDGRNKPSYAYSDDHGRTWRTGNVFIDVPATFRHRPYVKYASNGADTVHIFYTDGHPRDFENSTYHIFYRAGKLHRSDGSVIRSLAEGLRRPEEGTRIFAGNAENVGWVSDIHLDRDGRPFAAYSVQKDPKETPVGQEGQDLRYRYARWDGKEWNDLEIAHAGTRLYKGEDDYTGNIALDPEDPGTVYISTNADPETGAPLRSRTDGRRHWELYRGAKSDGGGRWTWTALTRDSAVDNIRPIVPKWPGDGVALLWLRGTYRAYTDYDLEVVTLTLPRGPAER
ncbi:MAG TPA: BNR-4 repeat-containing protein [Bryobacteraceae bacterium]|nr:BNR-4 repeat-containing protein [Bryobacteraceae bacterium]